MANQRKAGVRDFVCCVEKERSYISPKDAFFKLTIAFFWIVCSSLKAKDFVSKNGYTMGPHCDQRRRFFVRVAHDDRSAKSAFSHETGKKGSCSARQLNPPPGDKSLSILIPFHGWEGRDFSLLFSAINKVLSLSHSPPSLTFSHVRKCPIYFV